MNIYQRMHLGNMRKRAMSNPMQGYICSVGIKGTVIGVYENGFETKFGLPTGDKQFRKEFIELLSYYLGTEFKVKDFKVSKRYGTRYSNSGKTTYVDYSRLLYVRYIKK